MRIAVAISGVILAVFAGRAHADDIPVTSRIETVTVFPAGAEATRTARLSLGKGEHTLVFNDLPAEAVPGSIRVDGKATAGLDIQSVDTRRRYIPRADQETLQAERKAIEDEIEKLRDERGIIQGQEDAAQTQKTLLQNLAQMPGRPRAGGGTASADGSARSAHRLATNPVADRQRHARGATPGTRRRGEKARSRPPHRGARKEARRPGTGARRADRGESICRCRRGARSRHDGSLSGAQRQLDAAL